jgi:hypothetical protein
MVENWVNLASRIATLVKTQNGTETTDMGSYRVPNMFPKILPLPLAQAKNYVHTHDLINMNHNMAKWL